MDTRIFWEFAGGKDGLQVYLNNGNSLPVEDSLITQRINEVIHELESRNMYDMDLRVNTSLAYQFAKWGSVTLYCQNLLGLNSNKRYPYDAGDIKLYSSRWQYIQEPRTLGGNLEIHFQ